MPRLPQPGSDAGSWGDILNDYLLQSHKNDGTLKDNIVTEAHLAPAVITRLDGAVGQPGATGATGPQGPTGPAGPQGVKGDPGSSSEVIASIDPTYPWALLVSVVLPNTAPVIATQPTIEGRVTVDPVSGVFTPTVSVLASGNPAPTGVWQVSASENGTWLDAAQWLSGTSWGGIGTNQAGMPGLDTTRWVRASITNSEGTVASQAVSVSTVVTGAPIIVTQPIQESRTSDAGGLWSPPVEVIALGATGIQWQVNYGDSTDPGTGPNTTLVWKDVSGATGTTFDGTGSAGVIGAGDISSNLNRWVRAAVSNATGTTYSDAVYVMPYLAAPTMTQQPTEDPSRRTTLSSGTFSPSVTGVTFTGAPTPIGNWQVSATSDFASYAQSGSAFNSGSTLTGGGSATLYVGTKPPVTVTRYFRLRVTNVAGEIYSDTITVLPL